MDTIHTGAKGGQYRLSATGKKIYISKGKKAPVVQAVSKSELRKRVTGADAPDLLRRVYGSPAAFYSKRTTLQLIVDASEELLLNQYTAHGVHPLIVLFERLLKQKA